MDESFYPDEEEEEEEEDEESDRRRKRVQRKAASGREASRGAKCVGDADEGEEEGSDDEGEAEIYSDLNTQEREEEHDDEGDSDDEEAEEEEEEEELNSDDEQYSDQEEEGSTIKSKARPSKRVVSIIAMNKSENAFENEFQSPGRSQLNAEGEGEAERETEREGEEVHERGGRASVLPAAFSCMSPGLNICDIYNERAGQRLAQGHSQGQGQGQTQGQGRGGLSSTHSSSISMNSSLLSNGFKMTKASTPLVPAFTASSLLQKPYQTYTVKELQQFLKERKLTVSGEIYFYFILFYFNDCWTMCDVAA